MMEGFELSCTIEEDVDIWTARDLYRRLSQITFNDVFLDGYEVWSDIDKINAFMNSAVLNGKLAYYVGPISFAFDTPEGIEDALKHICKRETRDSEVLNDHYTDLLDKPFIFISNTETVLTNDSTGSSKKEGGFHWISWVLLPKKYNSLSHKKVDNNKYQVLFFDSLGERSFPNHLRECLTQGNKITEGAVKITLQPFCEEEETQFRDLSDLTGQQANGGDCGWWAVYYVLMTVYTGGVEFLEELRGKKLSAMPLRNIMPLQESSIHSSIQQYKCKRTITGFEMDELKNSSAKRLKTSIPDKQSTRKTIKQSSGYSPRSSKRKPELELLCIVKDNCSKERKIRGIRKILENNPKLGLDSKSEKIDVDLKRALDTAICENDLEVVQLLLENGPWAHLKDHQNQMSSSFSQFFQDHDRLCYAIKNNNGSEVVHLLENSSNLETVLSITMDEKDITILHIAVEAGDKEIVELLLNKGTNVNAKDKDGRTPLYEAALAGCSDMVKMLIEKGAKVDAMDIYGKTPADLARENNHNEIVVFLEKMKLRQNPQAYRKEEKVYLDLFKFVSSNISSIEMQSVKQGLYLPSFEARDMKVNGRCSAITRCLSQIMFLKDSSLKPHKVFLDNLKTSAEIYERTAQGKQISSREEKEVFALSSLLNGFEKELGSAMSSLPSNLMHAQCYNTFSDLLNYITGVKGDFAIHLVTNNHVVAIYRIGNNYTYFDSNVAFVSGLKSVDQLVKVVEKAVKFAGYEEEGFLVEYFDVDKANNLLSNEDKKILANEIKTERQLLAEQDKEFGLIKINGQNISRVQLYDFGTKVGVEGSVPLLINTDMNLNSKNFSEYLSAGRVTMTAREYLNSLKNRGGVEEMVQATKFIPFIGSRREIEKAEQTHKPKGCLAKEIINCILFVVSLAKIGRLEGQSATNTSTKPDSYLSEVKADNHPEKSLSF